MMSFFNVKNLSYLLRFLGVVAVAAAGYFGLHGFYKIMLFTGAGVYAAGAWASKRWERGRLSGGSVIR